MSDARASSEDLVPVGELTNAAGDVVLVSLQGAKVVIESSNEGREPVEVWLSRDDAVALAEVIRRAAGG